MAARINFTPELTQQIIDQYQEGVPVRIITKATGVSDASIHRLLVAKGVQGVRKRKKNTKFTPEVEQAMKAAYLDGKSLTQVGKEFGCAFETAYRILLRNDTPMRPVGSQLRQLSDEQVAEIVEAWNSGESQTSIGNRIGLSQVQVSRALRLNGYSKEHLRPTGSRHGSWKGGRTIANGYVSVLVASDGTYASMRNALGYVLEHRLVMAQRLGRPLLPTETVHHIDGDSLNNSPENLQLRQGKHGKGSIWKCGECGSTNVISALLD